ncbi:MAG: type II secretion system secretin GspD [Planctomycetota bacterium]|nr:type II secretion system secretin GspD [Planctomycetota bacterium]
MKKLLLLFAVLAFGVFALPTVVYAEEADNGGEETVEEKGPDEATPGKIYNFDGWDLKKAVEYLARKLEKPIVYTEGLSGTINYVSYVPIKEEDILPLFETLLNLNGWQMVDMGSMIKIVPMQEGQGIPSAFYSDEERDQLRDRDRIITQVFKLEYLDATEAMQTLSNFTISRMVVAIPQSNSLLITDYETVILRIAGILNAIDIPGPKITHKVVMIKNANVETLKTFVDSYLESLSSSPGAMAAASKQTNQRVVRRPNRTTNPTTPASSTTMAIPDPRTNSFILIGTEDEIEMIEAFIKDIDLESTSPGNYHVIRLKNIPAKDLAQTLNDAFAKIKQPQGSTEQQPVIIAFESQNSLIVLANQSQFESIGNMIEQLDLPQMQVLIRTVIVEVTTTKLRELGIELASGDFPVADNYRGFGTTFGATNKYVVPGSGAAFPGGAGVTVGLIRDRNGVWAIPSLLQAVQRDKDIELLAEPQILATDNEKASLTISEKIPYSTITNTDSDSNSTATYGGDYEAQIKLEITPHIRSGDYLTLEMKQTVEQFFQSEFSFDTVSGTEANRPAKTVREAETRVGVPNGGYVVIGGMTRTKTDETVSKVPWLGDIPGIGHLFRKQSRSVDKVNLYIFLQPEIIVEPGDLMAATERAQIDLELLRKSRRNRDPLTKRVFEDLDESPKKKAQKPEEKPEPEDEEGDEEAKPVPEKKTGKDGDKGRPSLGN